MLSERIVITGRLVTGNSSSDCLKTLINWRSVCKTLPNRMFWKICFGQPPKTEKCGVIMQQYGWKMVLFINTMNDIKPIFSVCWFCRKSFFSWMCKIPEIVVIISGIFLRRIFPLCDKKIMVKYCNNICYIMPFRFGDLLQPVGWRGNILRRKIWILPVSEFLPVLRMRRRVRGKFLHDKRRNQIFLL